WPALARGKVRFAGEPVVAVVAADAYRAEDALDVIRLTYEPLPVVADAQSALAPGAPRVHEELPDNALFRTRFEHGDVARALAAELARRLKRPVRWLEDRRENLLASAQARDHVNHVEVGARRDGTIVALKSTLICDSGAYSVYPVTASLEPLTAAGILPGPYK